MTKPSTDRTPQCATGVPGFDEIVREGLPRNRLYLVRGDPGVGKTTFAFQFLLEGLRQGEAALYITLSETKDEIEAIALSHGWKIDRIHLFELTEKDGDSPELADTTFFPPSEVQLNRTIQAIVREVERVKPVRVVFDSLSEMRMLADTPLRYRRQILQLKQYFAGQNCTVLFLDDRSAGTEDLQVESIAHGVINFDLEAPAFGSSRRRLHIQKIRGLKFEEGFHDFVVERGGLRVFPRLVAAEHRSDTKIESCSSGLAGLDSLLGGGLDRGTSTMFLGPPGTGKSTLAMKFVHNAAQRGEKALALIFDETAGTLLNRSRKLGTPLEAHLKSGLVDIKYLDPAATTPGELASHIRDAVLTGGVRLIVIDSINGYLNAMSAERHLYLQLHELLMFLNQRGVLTLMVLAQRGIVGAMASEVDLTYLADTVVLLRYFEVRGAVKQAISVIKKRSGDHERTIREIAFTPEGVSIGAPLSHMQGVLTGVPTILSSDPSPLPSSPS